MNTLPPAPVSLVTGNTLPPNTYIPLWSGSHFGGSLYITASAEDTLHIFFVLQVKGELDFVGELQLDKNKNYSPEYYRDVIMDFINNSYIEYQADLMKQLLESKSVRLQ